MDAYRDWGHSKDYVRAMHSILQHDTPGEWVVATGENHSVREMCEHVFNHVGLDYKDYVVQNPKFLRPEELPFLKGDCSKLKKEIGWVPEYTFASLMQEMVDHWLEEEKVNVKK
jgi:GDPmannose 4,6-dehydratase